MKDFVYSLAHQSQLFNPSIFSPGNLCWLAESGLDAAEALGFY